MKIEIKTKPSIDVKSDFENYLSTHKADNEIELRDYEEFSVKNFTGDIESKIVEMSIFLASNIGLGLLTNFLYDIIKGKVEAIWINDKEVSIDNIKEEINLIEDKEKGEEE